MMSKYWKIGMLAVAGVLVFGIAVSSPVAADSPVVAMSGPQDEVRPACFGPECCAQGAVKGAMIKKPAGHSLPGLGVSNFIDKMDAPANDDCENAEVVAGPFPVTRFGDTTEATIDCPGLLDWNAVWYEVQLPYASNILSVQICGTDIDLDGVGIIWMDDCACDDYVVHAYTDWIDCDTGYGGAHSYYANVPGPVSILYPVFATSDYYGDPQPGMAFRIIFAVDEYVEPTGACCVGVDCVATTTEAECDTMGGMWYEGETCPAFDCPTGCAHTITLVDSYGDGWNGGIIDVYVNGGLVAAGVTLPSGAGPAYFNFMADDGDTILLDYTAGSYSSENEYWLHDGLGNELCHEGAGGTPGDCNATGNCTGVPEGACCIDYVCVATTIEADCTGDWFIGETCPAFNCPAPDFMVTAPGSWSGNTCGMGNDCGLRDAEDAQYEVTIDTDGMWNFELCDSMFDTWMAVGTSLCGDEIGYNDDGCYGKALQSSMQVYVTAGVYHVDVEAYGTTVCGDYVLDVFMETECIVTCPGGADIDPEPDCYDDYEDTTNGGCNASPPVFGSLNIGTPLCGTAGTFLYTGLNYRDTDWFEFTTPGWSEVTLTLDDGFGNGAEFDAMLALMDPVSGDCSDFTYTYVLGGDCEVITLSGACSPPMTYWAFVAPSVFTGVPCDADYVLTATTVACDPCYCYAAGGDDEYIAGVQVGSINNPTGYSPTGYGDYTAMSTEMMPGGAYPMTVTLGNAWSSDAGDVWVDWNQDMDFNDPGEGMGMGWTGVGPYNGTVNVPGDALLGDTTMRVRLCWACTPAPCGWESYGEVEDYTITVIPPTGACCDQATPDCTITLEADCAGDWMGPCTVCGPDCDSDGLPDICDFFYGAQDCDGYFGENPNGIPDHCDIDQCTLTCDHFNGGWCCDCQDEWGGDGIPDGCQMSDKGRYTYMYDTGVTDNLLGLNVAGELVWIHHFVAQLNAEKITEIHSAFGGVLYAGYSCLSGGETVRLYVWSDPNGDGLPDDAVLLDESSGILAPYIIDTDMLQVFPVGPVVLTTGQSFFIGASIQGGLAASCYPAPIDGTVLNGEAYFAYGTAPAAFDPNNMIDLYASTYGAWLLRAEGEALGPPPNDCNENGIPDECDCGDGIADACIPEECDDAGESATCDPDCTFVVCGDDYLNATAGEECDDGASNSDTAPNACRSALCPGAGQECCLPWCGDFITDDQYGEDCDDGAVDTATCNFDCTVAVCGDFYVNAAAGEECDEGGVDTATCDFDCTFVVCGDMHVNAAAGEECEDGNTNVNDDCVTGSAIPAHNCQDAFCGDSYVWNQGSGTEVCDPAEATHGALCDQACAWEEGACCYDSAGVCVDGVLPEDCPGQTQHGDTPPRTDSTFYLGEWCFEIDCDAESIPTVSEWGLIVISLLLLTGIVIKFGRRKVAKS